MAKTEKSPITIEGVEYFYEDLTQEQQVLFNHCVDLDRKLSSARFNVDQLAVGREAFLKLLVESLDKAEAEAAAEVAEA